MTRTAPPRKPAKTQPSRTPLWLLIGVPVLVVLVIAATVVAVVLPLTLLGAVDERTDAVGNAQVAVSADNANFTIGPSTDGQVHVHITGRSLGRPRVSVTTGNATTDVRVRCAPPFWFPACTLHIAVAMPAAADVTVNGTNGAVDVRGIRGAVGATTMNGALDVQGPRGDVVLRTVNGGIRLTDATSATVEAETVNGPVDLGFRTVPSIAGARTTNGTVTVRVPGAADYAVTAHTTNGTVDTTGVRTDPASTHRISAVAVNGPVRVVPAG